MAVINRASSRSPCLIFFPIHQRDHWSLIVVKTKIKTILQRYLLGGSRKTSPAPRVMKEFMVKYYEEKLMRLCRLCGVFICQYAERLSRRGPVNFRQKRFRSRRSKRKDDNRADGKEDQLSWATKVSQFDHQKTPQENKNLEEK